MELGVGEVLVRLVEHLRSAGPPLLKSKPKNTAQVTLRQASPSGGPRRPDGARFDGRGTEAGAKSYPSASGFLAR